MPPLLLELLLRMQLFLQAIPVLPRLHGKLLLVEVVSAALWEILAEVPELLLESLVQLVRLSPESLRQADAPEVL